MNYVFLKYLHILCVAASFALFFVRGLWVMQTYPPATETWAKVLPHAIDTLLVVSALGMIATMPRFDWSPSMQIKLGLVVLYFGLAVLVFQGSGRRTLKALAWIGGLLLFLFITTVALLKQPFGIFSLF